MAGSPVWDAADSGLRAAVAHPFRTHLLGLLRERVASPKELAEAVEQDLPNVAYHVKVLEKAKAIELVQTVPGGRNSTEHFYRAREEPIVDDDAFLRMTVEERVDYIRPVAQLSTADLARALSSYSAGLDHDVHVTRLVKEVDRKGWKELARLLRATLNEGLEIVDQSTKRLERESGEPAGSRKITPRATGIPVRMILQLFQVPRQG